MARSLVSRLPRGLRPLSRRLPLVVASIVLLMMAVVLGEGFRQVHKLAAEVAIAHLQVASHQLRSAFQASVARTRREMTDLSRAPALEQAASVFASEADRRAALKVLNAELHRNPQGTVAVALWSWDGRLLLVAGDTGVARLAPPRMTETAADRADSSRFAIEPLIARGDSIFVPIVGRVRDRSGSLVASVTEVRSSARNTAGRDLLRGLVGADAQILLGNARENLWSDFTQPVPVTVTTADSAVGEHLSDGIAYLHSIEPVSGTPWRIMVEVPTRWATARAGQVILHLGVLAVYMMLVGVAIVWLAIHHSLRPLASVTDGVGRFADGRHGERVEVNTDDELGELATAFNAMAYQVEDSTRQLAARAGALEAANRDLEQSREQYRLLVDHLPDGILVHRDGRITFANFRSAQMVGLERPEDLVGRSIADFVATEERGSRWIRRPDRKRLLVETTDIDLSRDGEAATQTILHDITHSRLLEEELRHAQKMDAIGRLAGGVAHDFNNILTVIDAHAEFALAPGEPEETRREDIAQIRQASASAARLTRQLLAFSRKQALTPVQLDLNAIVLGLSGMLSRVLGQRIDIRTELAEPLWGVRADSGYLEQVIMNLAVNARDAMPDGGALDFRTANLAVGRDYRTATGESVPEGHYVLLTVEDTGTGMPEEIQSRVFEPFFTTKQSDRGTGLGLSTVYGIVKQSGGYIWLYSEPGRGTAFKILLPRSNADEDETPLTRTSEHRVQSPTARILVVEDQAPVRLALGRALRDAGFVVVEVSSAEAAEEFLAGDEKLDLVVADMMMSGKTGAELAAGPLLAGRDIPIVIMSGYSEDFTNRQWKLPPNTVFLDKPVAPSDLIRLVNRLLR